MLVALLVCLIPTTIGALLSAIGIAGMDRLVRRNVLAMSGRAVEAAGDCATLLLDKTGTITFGNRQATEFLPLPRDRGRTRGGRPALQPRRRDARRRRSWRSPRRIRPREPRARRGRAGPFTAQTRMTGVDLSAARSARARPTRWAWIEEQGGDVPAELGEARRRRRGEGRHAAGRRRRRSAGARRRPLKDIVKPGIGERFDHCADGHPHGDDHRRQPAHRGRDRRRRPGSTTSSPKPRPRTRWR